MLKDLALTHSPPAQASSYDDEDVKRENVYIYTAVEQYESREERE